VTKKLMVAALAFGLLALVPQQASARNQSDYYSYNYAQAGYNYAVFASQATDPLTGAPVTDFNTQAAQYYGYYAAVYSYYGYVYNNKTYWQYAYNYDVLAAQYSMAAYNTTRNANSYYAAYYFNLAAMNSYQSYSNFR